MISILGKLEEFKNSVKSGAFARLLAVLLGGTLNQRAFAAIGLTLATLSLYYTIRELMIPMLLAALGGVLTWLAIRDYEKHLGKRN